jgi:hypothetical protein
MYSPKRATRSPFGIPIISQPGALNAWMAESSTSE